MLSGFFPMVGSNQGIIQSLVVVLSASSLVAIIFQRLRLALIPAFIFAGILSGPSGLGLVQLSTPLEEIGHLAVVLLLFGVGMELHLSSLKQDFRALIGSGIGACLLCSLLGTPVVMLFGLSLPQSLAVAMALSLSSTALVLRLLTQSRDLGLRKGKLSLAILVTQDLFVLIMLALIPSIAGWHGVALPTEALATNETGIPTGVLAAIGLVIIVLAGRTLLPKLLHESIRGRAPEVLMLTAIAAALVSAYATERMGFSLEMGAFIIGFLLAASPFRHQLASQVAPLRDLFMAVFFTTLGMELNLAIVLDNFLLIFFGAIILLFTKAICIGVAAWLVGVQSQLAIRVGITLAQAGEFSLIIVGKSADFSLLSEMEVSILTGIIVLSLLVTPALYVIARRVSQLIPEFPNSPAVGTCSLSSATPPPEHIVHSLAQHVIIAGFGPVGRQIAEHLDERKVPYVVVELNPGTVRKSEGDIRPVLYGDISNETVLRAAHVEEATALVISFPDSQSALNAAIIAHGLNPSIKIVARTVLNTEKAFLDSNENHFTVSDENATAREMTSLVNAITEDH